VFGCVDRVCLQTISARPRLLGREANALDECHHDEVVAMDATEDASALVAGLIMTLTLGRPLNIG
jgi:hypothetical protein